MSLAIFLLMGLSTSSFFLPNFLTNIINKNEHTVTQLNFAISQDNEAALLYEWQQSKYGSEDWQALAKKLAKSNGEVAFLLADYYLREQALVEGFSASTKQAKLWYQQAIRLHFSSASIALAELYFLQGNTLDAQKLLNGSSLLKGSPHYDNEDTLAAIILSIKIAISIGDIKLVQTLLKRFPSLLQNSKTGTLLLSEIKKYQVLPIIDETGNHLNFTSQLCPNSIQIFATNIKDLALAEQRIEQFKQQPLNKMVCFSPVRYLSLLELSCSTTPKNAILCEESKFDMIASSVKTRYMAIMLPEGGANVHFGILYFDVNDSVDIIEHEISHLLGFIDEYPLSKGHVKCDGSQLEILSQNIAVLPNSVKGKKSTIRAQVLKQLAWAKHIKKSTPILHRKDTGTSKDNEWYLGTPQEFEHEVGVFKSSTCNQSSAKQANKFNAFKPLSKLTKLEYNTLTFPKQYLLLLRENPQQFIMPSFHYNIALAYYQQGNVEQANYWLEQAANWESDISRRKKVRQGNF